jgi:ribosomal-protein-alanine N-acetyltransferase
MHPQRFHAGYFEQKNLVAFALGLKVERELDILALATTTRHRRRGYAISLLKYWFDCGSVDELFLEVSPVNAAAFSLYQKAGFEITGVRKKYYDGHDDALCMKKTIRRSTA